MAYARPVRPRSFVVPLLALSVASSACKDEPTPANDKSEPADAEPGDAAAKVEPTDTPPQPPPEPPKEKAEGWGVLGAGAAIYAQPTGEPIAHLPDTLDDGIVVLAKGEVEGGRVRIESHVDAEDKRCTQDLSGLRDFSLRLFVDRKSFVEVTKQVVAHEFEDGTSVELGVGVPVTRAPLASATAKTLGVTARLPVEGKDVARFFSPGEAVLSADKIGWLPEDGDPLHYADGQTLDVSHLLEPLGLPFYEETPKDGEVLATIGHRCLEAKVLVSNARRASARDRVAGGGLYAMKGPKDAVPQMARSFDAERMAKDAGILGIVAAEADDEDVWGGLTGTEIGEAYGVGGLGLVGSSLVSYTVAVGTKVLWADGTPAGSVVNEHRFSTAFTEEGQLRCWDVPLSFSGPEDTVRLCFAAEDAEEGGSATGYGFGTGSGYGRGAGAGFGSRGTRVPSVRQAKAEVKGSLDKDIIRRIVRAHINEVRYCYNQGLVKNPSLSGKVTIDFTIDATGKVSTSSVASETISDSKVSECIAKAVKRWKFPKPTGGGVVKVTYPFSLEPG